MSTLYRHGPRRATRRERLALWLLGGTPCVANVIIGPRYDGVRSRDGRSVLAHAIDFDFSEYPVLPPDGRGEAAPMPPDWEPSPSTGAFPPGDLPRFLLALAILAAGVAIFLGLGLVGLLGGAGRARAHEWYPYSCCSDKDCRPVHESEVRLTAAGWFVIRTGETIPFAKARVSPDGRFHICSFGGLDDGRTICLFAPGTGS